MVASLKDYPFPTFQVYRCLDGGITWDDWSTGLPASYDWNGQLALTIDETGSTYLGSSNGVYRRLPFETAWQSFGLQGNSIRALVYHPGQAPMLLAAGDIGLWRLDLPPIQSTWLPLVQNAGP